jgi:outer membrane protein assembly factor BamD (BamD/ComL family)
VRTFLIAVALIASAGCASFRTGAEADYQAANSAAKEKKYQEAATLYRNAAAQSPASDVAADALYQLAYVQALYDNPQKDYAKALQGFDEFVKRYPAHPKAQEAETWRSLLRTLLDLRKENERLHKNIEQLRKLDIRHEERRKEK